MSFTERLAKADPRHMPDNVVPMQRRPERRATPRWMEWTREHQSERNASADLTGYLKGVA